MPPKRLARAREPSAALIVPSKMVKATEWAKRDKKDPQYPELWIHGILFKEGASRRVQRSFMQDCELKGRHLGENRCKGAEISRLEWFIQALIMA